VQWLQGLEQKNPESSSLREKEGTREEELYYNITRLTSFSFSEIEERRVFSGGFRIPSLRISTSCSLPEAGSNPAVYF
jgi:hypothetical protein